MVLLTLNLNCTSKIEVDYLKGHLNNRKIRAKKTCPRKKPLFFCWLFCFFLLNMGTAAKAMGKKERSPDLSLAIAVSLMEVHQHSVICWPNLSPLEPQKSRTTKFFFISLATTGRSSSNTNPNKQVRECLTVIHIILYFSLFFRCVVL